MLLVSFEDKGTWCCWLHIFVHGPLFCCSFSPVIKRLSTVSRNPTKSDTSVFYKETMNQMLYLIDMFGHDSVILHRRFGYLDGQFAVHSKERKAACWCECFWSLSHGWQSRSHPNLGLLLKWHPVKIIETSSVIDVCKMPRTCPWISDIDECGEDTDGCEQRCVNEPGTFRCDCDPGYTLRSDNKTCAGEMA